MAKHSRKRQKLHNNDKRDKKNGRREKAQRVPLGTPHLVDNEAEKDDEERKLESMLFGTKYVPTDISGMEFMVSDEEDVGERPDGEEEGAGQLQHLSDSDVRVFSVISGRGKDVGLSFI
jgi:U3 small nucleolar RNA-associated protein 18